MNYFQLRRLAIRMSNAVKGFIRTITGVPPVTLENCVDDKSVINYQIYGNTVQDGESSPGNPVEVKSVGVRTRNLFSEDNLSGGYGVVEYNGVRCLKYADGGATNDNFKITGIFEPNTKYYVTMTLYTSDTTGTKDTNMRVRYTDGTIQYLGVGTSKFGTPIKFSTYANKTISEFESFHSWGKTLYLDLTNLQIEKDAFTDYEPYGYKIPVVANSEDGENVTTNLYLNEPLRAIGEYKDYIDFENRKLVRNVSIYVFKGNEALNPDFMTNALCYPLSNKIGGICISTHFVNKHPLPAANARYWGEMAVSSFQTSGIGFFMINSPYSNVNNFKQFLSTQYSNGTPIEVYYVYQTPTEEPIDLPNLPTFKGKTVTYTIDTEVQPTEMSVTYYSNTKGE